MLSGGAKVAFHQEGEVWSQHFKNPCGSLENICDIVESTIVIQAIKMHPTINKES